jgi:chemotaxis signal transduction protein
MSARVVREKSPTAKLNDLSGSDKHCIFRCDRSWFSLPAICVREITIAPDFVRIPNCHRTLAGLCHLRSEFIPVLSLTELLSVDRPETPETHGKLMVINGSSVWAMLIAEAAALESLETLVALDLRMDDMTPTPVTGTAMFRDQIVRVLDPIAVFRMAQQSLESGWQGTQIPFRDSDHHPGSQR